MFRRFLAAHGGSILPTFAIVSIPLIVAVGAVVDYTNAFHQRTVVQDALDAAALAAGKQVGVMTTDQVKAEAVKFFNGNVADKLTITPPLETGVTGANIDLSTTLHVPTYFLGLIGLNEFIFRIAAESTSGIGTLEVALVLDNSGSMSGTKIATLKTAATNLTNTLYGLATTSTKPDPIKLAIVPFSAAVNVGPGYSGAAWMDTGAKGTYHADAMKNFGSAATTNNLTLFSGLKNSSNVNIAWGGCVEERPIPYDATDDSPSTAANPTAEEKKTLFVPMFAADEPDNWTCSTGSCSYSGTTSSTRRYNGAPSGGQSYNNYLPDACGALTVTIANPAVFTLANHGVAAGNQVVFHTTGSLPTGLTAGTTYYAVAIGLSANNFQVSASNGSTTVTIAPATNANFTVNLASPGVFTSSGHGLTVGTAIKLSTTGALPTGLTNGNTYYVKTVPSSSTFTVSATNGGTAINTSGSQSGTHSWVKTAPTVFTASSHGMAVNQAIVLSTTGSLPTGLTKDTVVYYVQSVPSLSTFTLSTTVGGAGLVATGSQSGAHTYVKLLATTGSQSGTHSLTNNWTCQSGAAGCGGVAYLGKSEGAAVAGSNLSAAPLCKYGTPAAKATVTTMTVGGIPGGPNFMCTTPAITPLTVTKATITTAINNLVAQGATNILSGVAWGWRVLSPDTPFTDGRSYADDENKKVIVLMTDGENTYYPNSQVLHSWYGAQGYTLMDHLATGSTSPSSSTLTTTLNTRTKEACANARAAGVIIYTVGFDINTGTVGNVSAALDLLQNCATDLDKYFNATNNTGLLAAFQAIGDSISQLRIAK